MRLDLIRHAKTKDSSKGLVQKDDAEIIVDGVDKDIFKDLNPDKVYSSPYKRAVQTADILFDDYEVLDFIYEFKAPSFLKGKGKNGARTFWDKHLPSVRKNPDWKYEDSESFNEIVSRVNKLIDFLKEKDFESVAIVGHGTFFRHLLGVLKFGEDYNFSRYEKHMANMVWDNLEMREAQI